MTHRIEVTPAAVRQLRKLDGPARRHVQAAIELIAGETRPARAKKLAGGDGDWRVRTGDFQIIYAIDDSVLLVLVVVVGHRREVYQRGARILAEQGASEDLDELAAWTRTHIELED